VDAHCLCHVVIPLPDDGLFLGCVGSEIFYEDGCKPSGIESAVLL
jgi:hypothetical protein